MFSDWDKPRKSIFTSISVWQCSQVIVLFLIFLICVYLMIVPNVLMLVDIMVVPKVFIRLIQFYHRFFCSVIPVQYDIMKTLTFCDMSKSYSKYGFRIFRKDTRKTLLSKSRCNINFYILNVRHCTKGDLIPICSSSAHFLYALVPWHVHE